MFVCQVEAVKEEERKAELLNELHRELGRKDFGGDKLSGIRVSFRFPCGRVDHTFPANCSVKVGCKGLSEFPSLVLLRVAGAVSVCPGKD